MPQQQHPVVELSNAIDTLRRGISPGPDEAKRPHQLGVLLLTKHGWTCETALLDEARDELLRAVELRPRHAASHAALGYTYDLSDGEMERALASFRRARRLNPRNREYDVYVLTLLRDSGSEDLPAEIEEAAPRHGVDLDALRQEFIQAGMTPNAADLLTAFIHARNFFKSSLDDEAERILNALQPGRARTLAKTDLKRCLQDQQELERSFDASRVPQPLQSVAKWASRYGIDDDICRPCLLKRLSKKQRSTLVSEIDDHVKAIQAWLDTFGEGQKPPEAAAFMYLTIGVEEIRE